MRQVSRPINTLITLIRFQVCVAWMIIALIGGREVLAASADESSITIDNVRAISREQIPRVLSSGHGQTSNALLISASRGEYEPASFVVRSRLGTSSKLGLTASSLKHATSDAEIPSSAIDIRWVKYWYQSFYGWNEIGKAKPEDFRQVLLPELLLKDDSLVIVDRSRERNYVRLRGNSSDSFVVVNEKALATSEKAQPSVADFPVQDAEVLVPMELSSGEAKQVWVTVSVPEGVEPGLYVGEIQIALDGHPVGFHEIRLTVHSFRLAKPKVLYSIYYRGQLSHAQPTVGSEYKSLTQMRHELLDLQRHGINVPTMYQASNKSRALLTAALNLRRELGMNQGPMFYVGIETTANSLGKLGPIAEQNLRRLLPRLVAEFRDAGFSDVYIYGKDEARGTELVDQRKLWRIAHDMGAKIFVAGYTGSYQLIGDLLDVFVHAFQPDPEEAITWHEGGGKIFNYANPQTGPENPYLFRLNYGLVLWADGYDGAMPYAYQHCFGSCWNDMDHPVYRDHVLAYPTADGVIPTLAWEGLREGIDDVRYLATLEDAITSGHGTSAAIAAQTYLDTLRRDVHARQGRFGKYNQNLLMDLNAIRDQVVSHILAIAAD